MAGICARVDNLQIIKKSLSLSCCQPPMAIGELFNEFYSEEIKQTTDL